LATKVKWRAARMALAICCSVGLLINGSCPCGHRIVSGRLIGFGGCSGDVVSWQGSRRRDYPPRKSVHLPELGAAAPRPWSEVSSCPLASTGCNAFADIHEAHFSMSLTSFPTVAAKRSSGSSPVVVPRAGGEKGEEAGRCLLRMNRHLAEFMHRS
jgi:hypothetical protein